MFRCNKLRFFALAAESIFVKYSTFLGGNSSDQESLKMVNCFMFDAIIAVRMLEAILIS